VVGGQQAVHIHEHRSYSLLLPHSMRISVASFLTSIGTLTGNLVVALIRSGNLTFGWAALAVGATNTLTPSAPATTVPMTPLLRPKNTSALPIQMQSIGGYSPVNARSNTGFEEIFEKAGTCAPPTRNRVPKSRA